MRSTMQLIVVLALSMFAPVASMTANPIEKVISLLTQLQQKIIKDGEEEQAAYEEFTTWCQDTSREKMREIKDSSATVEDLKATIEEAQSKIDDASTIIGELSSKIAADESDLKDATLIREKEHSLFEASDKELAEAIDTLARAQSVISKEMGKSSFLQAPPSDELRKVTSVLQDIVQAAGLQYQDTSQITAFLQQRKSTSNAVSEDDDDDDLDELGAPPAAKSGGILDVLADMQEKAEAQQGQGQKAEANAKQNYMMLKATLENKLAQQNKELEDQKSLKAGEEEVKATAEGELSSVEKELADDQKTLQDCRMDCMSRASDFEQETASRAAELKALATAKKFITEAVSGASLAQTSFVQLGSRSTSRAKATTHAKEMDSPGLQAVQAVRQLAEQMQSPVLAQFAQRMSKTLRGHTTADPFKKVKGMIEQMIAKLDKELQEEAGQKAFCDKEMKETKKSKDDKISDLEDLSTKIEEMLAKSTELKEEASTLSRELVELAKSQKEMTDMRQKEHAEYVKVSGDLKQGLSGIQSALKVLRDYYAKDDESFLQQSSGDEVASQTSLDDTMNQADSNSEPKSGGASGIIGLLEVAESDFSKNLAEVDATEEAAQDEYDKITQENKVTKASKEQDVKYMSRESKSLAKAAAELQSDRDGIQDELDAVLEYWEKLKPQCITKAPSYEERKKRREQEIAGLQNAMAILEGQAVFVQRHVEAHV